MPLHELKDLPVTSIWEGVVGRALHGDRLTMAVIELEANRTVPEHRHDNEQMGIVLSGTVTFRIDREERTFGPGGVWLIPSNVPHEVTVGAEGAVVIDVFAPHRSDWQARPAGAPTPPNWPV